MTDSFPTEATLPRFERTYEYLGALPGFIFALPDRSVEGTLYRADPASQAPCRVVLGVRTTASGRAHTAATGPVPGLPSCALGGRPFLLSWGLAGRIAGDGTALTPQMTDS